MKKCYTYGLLLTLLLGFGFAGQAQTVQWAKGINATGTSGGNDVVLDATHLFGNQSKQPSNTFK